MITAIRKRFSPDEERKHLIPQNNAENGVGNDTAH